LIRELNEEIELGIDKSILEPTGLVNKFTYRPENLLREGMIGETHHHGWFESDKIAELLPFPGERRIFLESTKKFNLIG